MGDTNQHDVSPTLGSLFSPWLQWLFASSSSEYWSLSALPELEGLCSLKGEEYNVWWVVCLVLAALLFLLALAIRWGTNTEIWDKMKSWFSFFAVLGLSFTGFQWIGWSQLCSREDSFSSSLFAAATIVLGSACSMIWSYKRDIVTLFTLFNTLDKNKKASEKYAEGELYDSLNFSLNFFVKKKVGNEERIYLYFRTLMEKRLSDIVEADGVRQEVKRSVMKENKNGGDVAREGRIPHEGTLDMKGVGLDDPFIPSKKDAEKKASKKQVSLLRQVWLWLTCQKPKQSSTWWDTLLHQTLNTISGEYGENFLASSAQVKSVTDRYVFGLTCEKGATTKKIRCMIIKESDLRRLDSLKGKKVYLEQDSHCIRVLTLRKMAQIYEEENPLPADASTRARPVPCIEYEASQSFADKMAEDAHQAAKKGKGKVKRLRTIELTFPSHDGTTFRSALSAE